jgi:hypothetical protein
LTVSEGALNPVFAASTTGYTVNVANNVTSIDVIGTVNHPNATISGNETGKTLVVGDNVVSIIVTAEDGTMENTYTVTVVRAGDNDATLNDLTVNIGKLTPVFSPDVTDYTVNVSNTATSISVTGTANHSNATVEGDGDQLLDVGNNDINIVVTAEDGITTKTYTVTVIRDASISGTDVEIIRLAANGDNIPVTETNLTYAAGCSATSVILEIEVSRYATYTVEGAEYAGQSIPLIGDITMVFIQVIAETGSPVKNYYLTVTKSVEDNKLYFQRWDDVLAINNNPANNGGHYIEGVRWYEKDGSFIGTEGYISIQGSASNYYAEIKENGNWRHVCGTATRSISTITAYPNPVSRGETVTLKLPESFVGGYLNIFGITGSLVKSKLPLPAINNSIDVLDLPTGVYLLNVISKAGNSETVKIIIE